jgi:hypothetical protein
MGLTQQDRGKDMQWKAIDCSEVFRAAAVCVWSERAVLDSILEEHFYRIRLVAQAFGRYHSIIESCQVTRVKTRRHGSTCARIMTDGLQERLAQDDRLSPLSRPIFAERGTRG